MVRASCWFCQEKNSVAWSKRNSFDCVHCGQYNGFTSDGDYNKSIPAQWAAVGDDGKRNTLAEAGFFHSASDVLCRHCTNNQALKVRNLANFQPQNEHDFDNELKIFQLHLERIYALCADCESKVRRKLLIQNSQIRDNCWPQLSSTIVKNATTEMISQLSSYSRSSTLSRLSLLVLTVLYGAVPADAVFSHCKMGQSVQLLLGQGTLATLVSGACLVVAIVRILLLYHSELLRPNDLRFFVLAVAICLTLYFYKPALPYLSLLASVSALFLFFDKRSTMRLHLRKELDLSTSGYQTANSSRDSPSLASTRLLDDQISSIHGEQLLLDYAKENPANGEACSTRNSSPVEPNPPSRTGALFAQPAAIGNKWPSSSSSAPSFPPMSSPPSPSPSPSCLPSMAFATDTAGNIAGRLGTLSLSVGAGRPGQFYQPNPMFAGKLSPSSAANSWSPSGLPQCQQPYGLLKPATFVAQSDVRRRKVEQLQCSPVTGEVASADGRGSAAGWPSSGAGRLVLDLLVFALVLTLLCYVFKVK